MARPTRLCIPGIPLHVIQRGNNKQPCFHIERDYRVFLNKLKEYSDKFEVPIHSFVLMTNHVHLLLTPTSEECVAKMMHSLGTYYVRYFNNTYTRTGTLWEGRYNDSLVCTEQYFLNVSRYIELNPTRAFIVAKPEDYPWSSYRSNGLGHPTKLLQEHPLYTSLGSTKEARRSAYRDLFLTELSSNTIKTIRTACKKSGILGDEMFKRRIEEIVGHPLPPLRQGRPRKEVRQ
jgi:putative transposase